MISEVELRDWEQLDFKKLERQALEGGMLNQKYMLDFIKLVQKIHQQQVKNTIPALLRK